MSTPLCLPFRGSTPLQKPISDAIKTYISSKYDQHPDMFTADLAAIDNMRTGAINVKEPHKSGLLRLGQYAAVLWAASGKFPVDIGCDFVWYPALGYNTQRPITQNNLQFERANILFNLAALYSQLATSTARNTTDGLRIACNYFQACAGTLEYIKNDALPKMRSLPPEDMDEMTMEAVKHLMLAQAQECFWQKAVVDGKKDSLIAKLAATVSDLYATAGDFGLKSDSISSDWIHHMNAKHHHFAAAAHYRAACDCLERSKYGEEIARLGASLKAADEALIEARYVSKLVMTDLQGLRAKVTECLKRAEKDNDMIYLVPVPDKSQLVPLGRACMVKADLPTEIKDAQAMLTDGGAYGPPLFQKLVPFAVHVAASIYAERRDRAVNNTVEEIEQITTSLRDLLRSLNLPGSLQALEKPLGLPQSLMAHVEEIRQGGGVDGLQRAYRDVSKIKQNDAAVYNEAVEMLKVEDEEDHKMRMRHGTDRWSRQPSKEAAGKLAEDVENYGNILRSADSSDRLIGEKIKICEPALRLMQGDDQTLKEFVPNSHRPKMPPKVDREVQKLRALLNDVSRVESRRRRFIEILRERAKADDITTAILTETSRLEQQQPLRTVEAADFEDLFSKRLTRYDEDKASIQHEMNEQDGLISKIQDANTSFLAARRTGLDSNLKEREEALQTLENAYTKYKEVIGNLESGRMFYNNLATLVARFRDEVKLFVHGRRLQADTLEADIESAMSSLRLSNGPAQVRQQHQQYQQPLQKPLQQPLQPQQMPIPASVAGNRPLATTPLPAPQAQRPVPVPNVGAVWTPEQGIRFGPAR